ncbi:MAG: hypothetical protein Q4F53_09525, partial [Nesterenkonia sp.]|nr:hypothetical protein [Nesterenkonia sp.]
SYQSYRPHQPAPSHDPSQPAHQAQQAQQAQQYVPPRPPVAVGPIPWGSFLLGALIVWLLLGALVTLGLWLVGLSGPAGADLTPPGLTAFAVVAMVAAGPLSLIAVHRPGTGLRLGHRRLHRATWASLGVGVGVLVLALPLWALLGLLPQTWWRPPLGAPVLDSVIAVLFLLGTTFGVHAGALLMRRGAVRGAWSRLAGISGWVLSAATVLCALLFASVWIEAIVTADDSLRLGIVLFAGIGALIGWIAHLLACRVPAPVNAPQPSSPPAVDHIRSDIDVTGTTYPSPYRSEPPRRHP